MKSCKLKILKNSCFKNICFLDPPYDTDFSTYAQNEFGHEEQKRLCECLKRTPAKILLIIKNTDFIYELYKDNFNITSFDKKYMVSFMNRNLLGGLYRENPVKSRNYEAVKSSKKWENVGNSYIIPALLLYRYSYI